MNVNSLIVDETSLLCDEKELCLVCNNPSLEKLLTGYSRYVKKLFYKVAICESCGHVQISPVFGVSQYKLINDDYFNAIYLPNGQQNEIGNEKKSTLLRSRLSKYLMAGKRVLDVGAGEGWAMNEVMGQGCSYYAIESLSRLAESITERGGHVIGSSLELDYSNYESSFDIIIFRHILEHLVEPKKSLLILKKLLSVNGIIYLALPNAEKPTSKKGFRTSFIRPVHISYFCPENVSRLVNSVGLKAFNMDSTGEIFCLLKHGDILFNDTNNSYEKIKSLYQIEMKKSLKKDFLKILRDITSIVLFAIKKKLTTKININKNGQSNNA